MMQYVIQKMNGETREWYTGECSEGSMWSDIDTDALWFRDKSSADLTVKELSEGEVVGFEV